MRKLTLFTLGIYLSLFFSPLLFASSPTSSITAMCPKSLPLVYEDAQVMIDGTGETYDVTYKKVNNFFSTYDIEYDSKNCGKENPTSGAYEKGDCSAGTDIKFITEISEPIGGTISSESTGGEGEVIEVYKGICCMAGGYTTSAKDAFYCAQTRNVYYGDYSKCTSDYNQANYCQKVQWLISKTGAGLIKTYVKQIYVFGAGIVGFIAVAVIVGSGIQISLSGASGDITTAKDRIIQSLMGIALLFLSALILYTINPTFFQ